MYVLLNEGDQVLMVQTTVAWKLEDLQGEGFFLTPLDPPLPMAHCSIETDPNHPIGKRGVSTTLRVRMRFLTHS